MPYHDTGTQMIPATVQPAQPSSANADPLPPDMSMESSAAYALESTTTYDEGHDHDYVIDIYGNGVAKQKCHPESNHVCHEHIIIDNE